MADIHLRCLDCLASIAMRPPDAFVTTRNGITLKIGADAYSLAAVTQATVDYMCEHGCPGCGGHDLELTNRELEE